MSKYLLPAILLLGLAGAVIAPPYTYTFEEKARLTRDTQTIDYILWPMRAYENWQGCGSISYCTKVRCAALEGGCVGHEAEIERARKLQEIREEAERRGSKPSVFE